MLLLVRKMRAVLHLRDLGVGVVRVVPVVVRPLFLPFAIESRQVLSGGRLDAGTLGEIDQELLIAATVVPPNDGLHGGIRFQGRPIDADRLALDQPSPIEDPEHPGEDGLMGLDIDALSRL